MALPLPHQLTRPITLRSPSPGTVLHACDNPDVCTHDYAYAHNAAPAQAQMHRTFSNPGAPFSLQARTSTNISQYNLVSTGNGNSNSRSSSGSSDRDALMGLRQMIGVVRPQSRSEKSRVRERERAAQEEDQERQAMAPQGPAMAMDNPPPQAYNSPAQAPELVRRERERESPLERQHRSGTGMPLERLFKKRFWTRQSGSSGSVPDIMVESPPRDASAVPDAADFTVSDSDPRPLPPLPEFYLTTPSAISITNEDEQQLPAGFVPMSTADPPHNFAVPKAKGPRYSYEVTLIPPGVVYPDPPGRRSATPGRRSATPHTTAGVVLPPSPSSTPSPCCRHGSLSGHLSPLSLPLVFVVSPSAHAPSD
ncbi:predicted protein [Postia placenta Mad-698-R]|nr:predicted protein [Postia placenta Mad-698-R]